jgi:hypothetical protein
MNHTQPAFPRQPSMSKVEPASQIVIVEDNVEANNLLRDWLKLKFR